MASVRLHNITRQFGPIAAIADITFEVPDGQFWVLVGPSGCGKSTILRTIAGLESATAGDLYIGDRRVNQVPARQRDVAMVFQNYALYPHLSVADNLAFGLQMRRVDAKTIQERVGRVATMLGIEHLLDRKPRQLSGGQQQRVALGRAIARQPQVFLLDEPLSNLDAQRRDDTRAELKQLHQQVGITTIYVTHDQVEAMTLADQMVVLHQGRIQQIGDPQTVYARPANRMVATFLGNPPMNLLHTIADRTELQINGQRLSYPEWLRETLAGDRPYEFDLGIRPEHLRIEMQRMDAQKEDVQSGDRGNLVVRVEVVEPLGREILVRAIVPAHESAPTQILNLLAEPTQPVRAGDRLTLSLDWNRVCGFDAATGDLRFAIDR